MEALVLCWVVADTKKDGSRCGVLWDCPIDAVSAASGWASFGREVGISGYGFEALGMADAVLPEWACLGARE